MLIADKKKKKLEKLEKSDRKETGKSYCNYLEKKTYNCWYFIRFLK
jgi:hypothetical protein